ncbi:MAG: 4Fe-4S binding protein [Candidatus Thiodiazotropha sp. (ex Rostrolucina anterorostrata)]|nr:4Fe-4S binding protein [Candidatus Thiodiazotropha sp. (ex Rostrolucina anterorostrata)]
MRALLFRGDYLNQVQNKRRAWRSGFFLLFILAPPLNIFRFDLNLNYFILFGYPWTLGMEAFQQGTIGAMEMGLNMLFRFFLPLALVLAGGLYITWKWGRLYCGWLCPHFSVVEMINALMRRASGKVTMWDKDRLPENQLDGTHIEPDRKWWLVTLAAVLFFSFLWAVALLTYLLPPKEIYGNLFDGSLTRNQTIFISVATLLLTIEFTFARHLFCRFGCALGLFQSLVWMGNKKAMVVAYDRKRAKACISCDNSCEHACPMRLKPRSIKRRMFTCTQCMQCIEACEDVQNDTASMPLLKMLEDHCALDVSDRDFGYKPDVPSGCFSLESQGKKKCCH